jgi:hypothetical protein
MGKDVVERGDGSSMAGDDNVVRWIIRIALRLIGAAIGEEEELQGRLSPVLDVGNERVGVRGLEEVYMKGDRM